MRTLVPEAGMKSDGQNRGIVNRLRRLWRGNNRARLMLTLELAVMLPAAALIYINFYHLKSIERDKVLEAAIHGDFHQMLAISEKQINQKVYQMTEEARALFPSAADSESDKQKKLDAILCERPWLAHVYFFDAEQGFMFRSQPHRMSDPQFREEHQRIAKMLGGWFAYEGKEMLEQINKRARGITWYPERSKSDGGYAFRTTAVFSLPQLPKDRVVLGGVSFDPGYLKRSFFPNMLEELIAYKLGEEGGNPLAMIVYPVDSDSHSGSSPLGGYAEGFLAASAGWTEGEPEVSRNLDDVFRGLALGIKFQGTSVEALGRRWVYNSLLILGALSLLMVGGLVLTYRSVSKEVALARLKADFVSNVSHELRTPLALIRLYAETLELGRIKTPEKAQEYYCIIRKESERLTALINNILDFSRIEAGRKEYEFRTTDLAELVTNTLDTYRGQIDEQGFTFEQSIDPRLPPVRVDREAIARSLVNLVNNALKYSDREKFLRVCLYRTDGVVKLEVADHGIGIARSEQSKIFEKFYRAGDPLVHNTKGSGLGLSLVRHIAHAHGGDVEVESAPGRGSKFTLTLPLEAAATEQPATNDAA
jgi:signal transduction histidine kinase